jgi:glycosyltransferase involved in cell wall biosynthesis
MMLHKKTILELNFKGLAEYRKRSLFLAIYIFIVRYFVFNLCLGACAVTEEIAEEFRIFVKAKNLVKMFPNSIDLEKFSTLPPNNLDGIRLVFVGSPGQSWHGVDRIILLAKHIPEFEFHVVGPIYESDNSCYQPKNVFFYGEIYGMKLNEIMLQMDIGISSLGMERIGLTEASPLKTRQYLALGLPVISGIRDSAIQRSEDFYLFLTENDLEFHEETLMKIRSFAANWKGRRVTQDRLSIINSARIERDRIEFIKYLLGNK